MFIQAKVGIYTGSCFWHVHVIPSSSDTGMQRLYVYSDKCSKLSKIVLPVSVLCTMIYMLIHCNILR